MKNNRKGVNFSPMMEKLKSSLKFKLWTTIWAIQQLSILTIPKAKHAFGYTYQTNATLGYEELDLTERTHISYNSL